MASMEIIHEGPFPKVTFGGLFVGYGVPADHPLFDQHAFSFLDDDGEKWYFVYAESVKPKSFSEAELAAELYRSIVDMQAAFSMLDLFDGDEYRYGAESELMSARMFQWEGHAELPSVWDEEGSNGD